MKSIEAFGDIAPGAVLLRKADRAGGDQKQRPCVVISTAQRCLDPQADTWIVVPLTSDTDRKDRLPMPLLLPDQGNGLSKPSAAMAARVSCLRRQIFQTCLGQVSPRDLRRIRLAVVAAIGLADLLLEA